jgi:hypothetical protein
MAIKISGTDVIGNSRELLNITNLDTSSVQLVTKELITSNTIASGTTIRAGRDTVISKLSTGYIEASRFGVLQRGVINFYFEGLNTDTLGTQAAARIQRLRNGSTTTILTQSLTSTSYVAYNTDQNVLPGDVFIYQIQGGSYVSGKGTVTTTGRIRNMRIRTSTGTYYFPTLASDFFGWAREQT